MDDVLRLMTLPYLQGMLNALYQQDNARLHTSCISQHALQGIQMLSQPLYLPDFLPTHLRCEVADTATGTDTRQTVACDGQGMA